jgi:hypothetical protein
MTRDTAARATLAFAGFATVAIVAVADVFNATHLFNPDWPGHARFHIGMQFTTLVLVTLLSLGALRGPLSGPRALVGAAAPLTFWPGLLVAWMIPGTDPYASEALRATGVPINIALALLFITITLAGLWLALARPAVARAVA